MRRGGSEVDPMKSGILPPLTTRGPITTQSYTHAVPLPHDVQMRAAGKQMVPGLMYPSKGRGEKTIISMLPKKLNPPPLRKEMGQVGWGLHAKMGFSQWRFLYWLFFLLCFERHLCGSLVGLRLLHGLAECLCTGCHFHGRLDVCSSCYPDFGDES